MALRRRYHPYAYRNAQGTLKAMRDELIASLDRVRADIALRQATGKGSATRLAELIDLQETINAEVERLGAAFKAKKYTTTFMSGVDALAREFVPPSRLAAFNKALRTSKLIAQNRTLFVQKELIGGSSGLFHRIPQTIMREAESIAQRAFTEQLTLKQVTEEYRKIYELARGDSKRLFSALGDRGDLGNAMRAAVTETDYAGNLEAVTYAKEDDYVIGIQFELEPACDVCMDTLGGGDGNGRWIFAKDGEPPIPPIHPNCDCQLSEYIYEGDETEEIRGATEINKVQRAGRAA